MRKAGAVSILTTMLVGFLAWTASAIVENKVKISAIRNQEKTTQQLLIELRTDVKTLLIRSK